MTIIDHPPAIVLDALPSGRAVIADLARLADQHAMEPGADLLRSALRNTLITIRTARDGDPATWSVDPADWAYIEADRLIDDARRQRERAEGGIPEKGTAVTWAWQPGVWIVTGDHEDGRVWIRLAAQAQDGGTFLDHLAREVAPEQLADPADLTPGPIRWH